MSPRHVDGPLLRTARLAAGLTQAELARVLGVTRQTVGFWEKGRGPDPERLPAVAAALGRDVDRLFPRYGAPDLADLRCDAGFAQYAIERLIGAKDAVLKAERGVRRLAPAQVTALATAYGVTEARLRAAEDRSFGETGGAGGTRGAEGAAEAGASGAAGSPPVPTTISEKVNYLLEHAYPDARSRPSDADIAHGINLSAGAHVISVQGVAELRLSAETETSPAIRQGLAQVFGVDEFFFRDNEGMADAIVAGLRTLQRVRTGRIGRIAARGLGPEGLSPELMHAVNALVDSLTSEDEEADEPRAGT
ncbi:helix-turn-helix transcriptional regulator [Streptomyces sp. G45]|uniref:helix-turn-helix transcriptional regulator n=1 Tax=Streptomyces sp. G45 TaxID=3406627 RepID=UPI003C193E12